MRTIYGLISVKLFIKVNIAFLAYSWKLPWVQLLPCSTGWGRKGSLVGPGAGTPRWSQRPSHKSDVDS